MQIFVRQTSFALPFSALPSALWLLAFLCTVITSCTSILEEAILNYEEQLVVSAILTAGDTVRNIHVMRSAPPLDKIDFAKHSLPDAKITLLLNGMPLATRLQRQISSIPSQGVNADKRSFFEAPGIVAQAGQHYDITVEWNGKRITASTRIPETPTIIGYTALAVVNNSGFIEQVLHAVIRPRIGEAYSVVGEVALTNRQNPMPRLFSMESNARAASTASIGDTMRIHSIAYSGGVSSGDTLRYFARVIGYDEAYAAYNESIRAGETSVRWSVKGNGIGIFIGATYSERRSVPAP